MHIADCPILSGSTESIPVKEWRLAPRAGKNKAGEQNTQIELTDASLPLKDVLVRFKTQFDKSRNHYNESEWLWNVRKVDIAILSRTELLIFTDFSATCDLHAGKLDNCSQDAHAVLAIFVVCHSPRFVTVKQEEEDVTHQINNCDAGISLVIRSQKGRKMTTFFIMPVSKRLLKPTSANLNVMVGEF